VNESFSASDEEREKAPDSLVATGYLRVAQHGARTGGRGILDYPHYTRPPSFRGWDVPEVLLGGNHAEILRWRRARALEKTRRNRPDLLDGAALNEKG